MSSPVIRGRGPARGSRALKCKTAATRGSASRSAVLSSSPTLTRPVTEVCENVISRTALFTAMITGSAGTSAGEGSTMDGLTEEEAAIVALVGDFVDREVRPVARELEHANAYPEKLIEQMRDIGIFGLAVPAPWGETHVSAQCYAAVTEELARGWMSLAGAMGGHTVVAKLIATFGRPEQKDAYLPKMATGQVRAAMALTEPGGGSDLQAMRTNARLDGNYSRDLPKLGYKGVESCELTFDDFRVPASALLGGGEGEGFGQMMRGLEIGRIQVACRALGVARAALEDSLRYAQQRGAFGKPIWQHQSVGNYLADMATKLEAARQLVRYAARRYDSGARADLEAGMAKLFRSEGRQAARPVRGAPLRLRCPRRPGGRHGEAVRLGDRDGDRAQRHADPRRLRLLDGVRRGAVLPRRAADDRRRGHQRDPALGHRQAAHRAEPDLTRQRREAAA